MNDLLPRLEVAETAVSSPKHSHREILLIENVRSAMGSLLLDFKGVNINSARTSAKQSGMKSRANFRKAPAFSMWCKVDISIQQLVDR